MIGVKICGLCRAEDAALAAESGASYAGIILAPQRRRSQDLPSAQRIFAAAQELQRVGVFVNQPERKVVQAQRELQLDIVQLHGSESVELVRALSGVARVWKAVPVILADDVQRALDTYASWVEGILLDASDGGGSGRSFDWEQVVALRTTWSEPLQLIVAGGLTSDNVRTVIARLRPDVVDVSSGVEARVGEKSAERVRAFISAACTPAATLP